jgi:hypothetical protein
MRSLGIDSAAETVQALVHVSSKSKLPHRADKEDDTDWNLRDQVVNSSDDEAETRKQRRRNQLRTCRVPTAEPSRPPGAELEGRSVRVSIFTEDVAGMAWHEGEVLRHRRRRGRDEHLIRWETEAADDEWLYLPEETYELIDLEEFHKNDAELAQEECKRSLRPGDCVAVMYDAGGGNGGRKMSFARLIERRAAAGGGGGGGGGSSSWSAHWFYGPEDLPKALLQSKAGKQVYFQPLPRLHPPILFSSISARFPSIRIGISVR